MPAVSVKDLRKTYQGGTEALKGVTLEGGKGDFFALLGPNGAGKTTLIGIVTSLVNKTSGRVAIFGTDIDSDRSLAKTYIGLVPQEFNFNIFEKVEDIVTTQAGYYGIPLVQARKDAEPILKDLGLWEKKGETSQNLSGGMKRRINAEGTTIILTTHYLEEAEHLSRNVAIINKGAILVNEPTKSLLARHGEKNLEQIYLDLTKE